MSQILGGRGSRRAEIDDLNAAPAESMGLSSTAQQELRPPFFCSAFLDNFVISTRQCEAIHAICRDKMEFVEGILTP
jgi:hypothetical protein